MEHIIIINEAGRTLLLDHYYQFVIFCIMLVHV